MPTASAFIKFRPIQTGILIEENNFDHLSTAIGINTMLWGGKLNPIIPVNTNNNLAEQLMKYFAVDIVSAIEPTGPTHEFAEKHYNLTTPMHGKGGIFEQNPSSHKQSFIPLDIKDFVDINWVNHFRHKSDDFKSNCCLIKWNESDPLDILFKATFGFFPKSLNLEYDFETVFLKGLKAHDFDIGLSSHIDQKFLDFVYPLNLTVNDLKIGRSHISDGGIFCGSLKSFDDIVCCWNERAYSDNSILFVAEESIDRFDEYIKVHIERVMNYIKEQNRPMERMSVYYNSLDNGALKKITSALNLKSNDIVYTKISHIPNGSSERPLIYFETTHTTANIEKSFDTYRATVAIPERKFLDELPEDSRNKELAASVDISLGYEIQGYTLKPPFLYGLSEKYSRAIAFDYAKIRSGKDGLETIINADELSMAMYPLSFMRTISLIFEYAGLTTELSQAGLLTALIIDRLGRLYSGGFLKIRGVRNLFNKLSADDSIDRDEAKRVIANKGQFNQYSKFRYDIKTRRPTGLDDVFDILLSYRFLRAGLSLRCRACRITNWLSLKELDDKWNCQYCGNENDTNIHLRQEGRWTYRKNGLFGKNNNQEGAVPVILALEVLSSLSHYFNLIYTPSLKIGFQSGECEIDFCVIEPQLKFHKPCIGIGECKSEGGTITQGDVDNAIKIYEAFRKKNIGCNLIFAKTADNFNKDEISLFKTLRSRYVPVILLTNTELESFELYKDVTDPSLPHKYAIRFQDMVENSEYLYLR